MPLPHFFASQLPAQHAGQSLAYFVVLEQACPDEQHEPPSCEQDWEIVP
jgi:hypothetical protein